MGNTLSCFCAESPSTSSELFDAALHGHAEAVRVLAEHGANVETLGRPPA